MVERRAQVFLRMSTLKEEAAILAEVFADKVQCHDFFRGILFLKVVREGTPQPVVPFPYLLRLCWVLFFLISPGRVFSPFL